MANITDQYIAEEISEMDFVVFLEKVKHLIVVDGEIDKTLKKHYLYKKKSRIIETLLNQKI